MLRIASLAAAVALFGLLQSAPLPDSIVGLISPNHLANVEATRELLGPETIVNAGLSVAPDRSRRAAVAWLAAAAVFVAAGMCGRDRRRRWYLFGAVVLTALLEVFFGAQRLFARATTIWGVEVPGDPSRLRGTFVNSDHLALYLQIALVVTFAWAYRAIRRARTRQEPERRVVEVAVPVLCWLILFVGLAFTGSRAGLVAALVAVAVQGLLLASALRNWGVAPAGILAGLLAVATVAWIGLDQGLGRLLGTSAYEVAWNARPAIYRAALELWQKFPLFGSGLGTFEAAFPLVQGPELSGLVWSHAHNDWLEMLVTTGLLGLSLLILGVWALVVALRNALLGSMSSSSKAFALAALGAVVGVGLHEALDFGLTMPANAVTLAVVLGAAVGVSRDYDSEPIKVIKPGTKGRRSAARSSSRDASGSTGASRRTDSPG